MPNISHASLHLWAPTIFLSALFLFPGAGGAANYIVASEFLPQTLQEAVNTAGNFGMVIVDYPVTLTEPLILPRFFRLVGMGPQGQGSLAYIRDSGAAIQFSGPETTSAVVIENLNIGGLYPFDPPGTSIGIALTDIHHVYLNNVTVRGFDVGIVGNYSFYVHVRDSNVSLNRSYNYHLIDNANSWRITGGSSSQSGLAAVRVETSNNTVIEQVSFESNQIGVHTSTESTHVLNNRFECSPAIPAFCAGTPLGIHIDTGATLTTLIGNYYSGLDPVLDTSEHGLTYRFDHDGGPLIQPPAGAEGLHVELTNHNDRLVFNADGQLEVGKAIPGSTARMTIKGSGGGDALYVDGDMHLRGDLVAVDVLCIGSGC